MDWPLPAGMPPLVTIHPFSPEAQGSGIADAGGGSMISGTVGSSVWPVANEAVFYPFVISVPITVVKLWVHNGGAVSGNIDVGIYDQAGTRLVSAGSTAQSGTSAIQEFDITDTELAPGLFYLALALDNATGAVKRWLANTPSDQAMGRAVMTSAFVLPATVTLATMDASLGSFEWMYGLTTRTVI